MGGQSDVQGASENYDSNQVVIACGIRRGGNKTIGPSRKQVVPGK